MKGIRGHVRVLCGRCRRKLWDMPGEVGRSSRQWLERDPIPRQGSSRFRCDRCGADHIARHDRLNAAFRRAKAAGRNAIVLPMDLEPVAR